MFAPSSSFLQTAALAMFFTGTLCESHTLWMHNFNDIYLYLEHPPSSINSRCRGDKRSSP